jgi:glycosyltransferase involved in cell wall biosynthesis
MSVEVATVMSPVGINKDIIQQGENGYLADTEDEWFDILCTLIENPALRDKLGKAGRQTVLEKYSVLSQRNVYLQHFRSLI